MIWMLAISSAAALSWLWLLLIHGGGFWRIEKRPDSPEPREWPEIVAVTPARNEAETIGRSVKSLLAQDYPGVLSVVLVDDSSEDGTADIARHAAMDDPRFTVVRARPLPGGWAGKVWAEAEGLAAARKIAPQATLYLLTDADIEHDPSELRRMVSHLLANTLDMASLMVRLSVSRFAERMMVPAFVYFFRLLYPFRRVNDPRDRTAAAAGGYVLIRRTALERAGGIAAIKGALIDDCSLAGLIKRRGGRIWLGLAEQTRSIRAYDGWPGLWTMIARSAYIQLRRSPILLAGTLLAMSIAFVAPPIFTFCGGEAAGLAITAWIMMSVTYWPILGYYGLFPLWAPVLPLVALIYMAATLDSARRHWQGKGGFWKGRVQAEQ
jgi:hopene-associated glycosyltransferase HpnB